MGGGLHWKDARRLKVEKDWLDRLIFELQMARKHLPKEGEWDMPLPMNSHWLTKDLQNFMRVDVDVQRFFKEARQFGSARRAIPAWDNLCNQFLDECLYLCQRISDEATRKSMVKWMGEIIKWKNEAKVNP